MAFGNPGRKSASLHVGWMLAALVIAAFLGASLGLVWLNSNWLSEDEEHEIVTSETPSG
jgi:hypothetical protein